MAACAPLRIGILGAGAIGCYLAARLIRSGQAAVAMLARGEQLQAISRNGLQLRSSEGSFTVHPAKVAAQARHLGPCDLVFVTTKAHSHAAAAEAVAELLAGGGTAVYVCNGIPWWWSYAGEGTAAPAAAPQERPLWELVRPQRVLGCVVYSANEIVAPGVVQHAANDRWVLGEPDGSLSPRLQAAAAVLLGAGLGAESSTELRREIWAKLLRNGPLNTLCALTRLPICGLAQDPALLAQAHTLVDEIAAVAAAHGCDVSPWVQAAKDAPGQGGAVQGASAAASAIRPSMLQDALAGRRLEVEAIIGRVQALARATGVATPQLDVLLPLARGLDRSLR